MDICTNFKEQNLFTTTEAALYLGVDKSYLLCAKSQSSKYKDSAIRGPRFVNLLVGKKGEKWIRYPKVELDLWLGSLPLQEKMELINKSGSQKGAQRSILTGLSAVDTPRCSNSNSLNIEKQPRDTVDICPKDIIENLGNHLTVILFISNQKEIVKTDKTSLGGGD